MTPNLTCGSDKLPMWPLKKNELYSHVQGDEAFIDPAVIPQPSGHGVIDRRYSLLHGSDYGL